MVHYFLEGGAFMWPILLTLIFGLAFVIERAYSLMMSAVDSEAFYDTVSQSIKEDGTESAVQVCKETDGPVAPQAWNQFEPSSKGYACDWTDANKGEKYKL